MPELPEGWVWVGLGELIDHIDAGKSYKAQARPAENGEYGVIKISAVTWGDFLPAENKALYPGIDPGNVPRVQAGDLLISRANTAELVGAVVLTKTDYPNLILSDKTLRLVPISEEISKEYLLYALRTSYVRKVYEQEATGVSQSMRNLSQPKILSAPIPLAPMREQKTILQKMAVAFERVNAIKTTSQAVDDRIEKLNRTVLEQAFQGKL